LDLIGDALVVVVGVAVSDGGPRMIWPF